MRVQQADGKLSEPIVVRHWRQEWRYQAERLLAYEGANTWALREVPAAGAPPGAWVQSVYQVDDSPRYAARGRWEHSDSFSTWISDETWRPLPRREFSVRKDYDVLVGTNRHTIMPTGWVQEENNLKLALAERTRAILRARIRRRALRAHPDYDFERGGEVLRAHRAVLGRGARRLARARAPAARFTLQRAGRPGPAVHAVLRVRRRSSTTASRSTAPRPRLRRAHAARALPRGRRRDRGTEAVGVLSAVA